MKLLRVLSFLANAALCARGFAAEIKSPPAGQNAGANAAAARAWCFQQTIGLQVSLTPLGFKPLSIAPQSGPGSPPQFVGSFAAEVPAPAPLVLSAQTPETAVSPFQEDSARESPGSGPEIPDIGSMRGELEGFQASNQIVARHTSLGTAYQVAAAPFLGATLVATMESAQPSQVLRISAAEPSGAPTLESLAWDYAQSGPLRLTLGGKKGLTLEVRSFRDLAPEFQRLSDPAAGYFIVNPGIPPIWSEFKELPDQGSVALGPKSPPRFFWPKGLSDEIKISRDKDVIRIEAAPGSQVQAEPAALKQEVASAASVKLKRRRLVSSDGNGASVTLAKIGAAQSEDAVALDAARRIILAADGMGGHARGRLASQIAKRVAMRFLKERLSAQTTPEEAKMIALEALVKAHATILNYADRHPEAKGMGTTLSIGVVAQGVLVTVSVGDSAIMVRRKSGKLVTLTKDESTSAYIKARVFKALKDSGVDMARVGRARTIRPEDIHKALRRLRRLFRADEKYASDPVIVEAMKSRKQDRRAVRLTAYETHPMRHAIYNFLGREDMEIDDSNVQMTRLEAGDIVLGVTDGLLDNVPEKRQRAIARAAGTPEALVDAFAGEARRIALEPRDFGEQRYSKWDDISIAAFRFFISP